MLSIEWPKRPNFKASTAGSALSRFRFVEKYQSFSKETFLLLRNNTRCSSDGYWAHVTDEHQGPVVHKIYFHSFCWLFSTVQYTLHSVRIFFDKFHSLGLISCMRRWNRSAANRKGAFHVQQLRRKKNTFLTAHLLYLKTYMATIGFFRSLDIFSQQRFIDVTSTCKICCPVTASYHQSNNFPVVSILSTTYLKNIILKFWNLNS